MKECWSLVNGYIIDFWFIAAATIVIGGSIMLAVYKGYCESKGMDLSSSDEETILFFLFELASLPITLSIAVIAGLCHLPFFIGKMIGKHF